MILVTSCAKAWQSQGLEATTIQVGHAAKLPRMAGLKARLPFLIFLPVFRFRSHQFCCRSRSFRREPYLHPNDSLVGSFAELYRLLSSFLDWTVSRCYWKKFPPSDFSFCRQFHVLSPSRMLDSQNFTGVCSSWSTHVSTFVTWVKGFQLKIFRCFGEEELGCWEIGCRRTHWVWLVFSNLVLDQVVEHTELG